MDDDWFTSAGLMRIGRKPRRFAAYLGVGMLLGALTSVAPATGQVLPPRTTVPTVSPTSQAPTRTTVVVSATTGATRPKSTTTRIPVATTAPHVTTAAPAETSSTAPPRPVPSTGGGGGTISPFFTVLSVGGFLAALGMIGRQWYRTKPLSQTG